MEEQKPTKQRQCAKCGLQIQGQFVRAIKAHYHLECFRCQDCGEIVADKFFPVTSEGSTKIYCEFDYFRRLELICARCGQALRGPYIRVNTQKYHMEHFSCSVCTTVFRQHDSYYEKDGNVYCGLHYSILYAKKCGGCNTAVLKNFVETSHDDKAIQWHPCCYMISKLWKIKLAGDSPADDTPVKDPDGDKILISVEIEKQLVMVEKVERILQILSMFEESAAECISEMLVHFTNEGFLRGALHAHRLIGHVDLLFSALQEIDDKLLAVGDQRNLANSKEPRNLVKKIVYFFAILSAKQSSNDRQTMIQLVTSLAHVLKIIIRNALTGALALEQEHGDKSALPTFLAHLQFIKNEEIESLISRLNLSALDVDCKACGHTIEEGCVKFNDHFKWHNDCFKCKTCDMNLSKEAEKAFINLVDGMVFCKEHKPLDAVDELLSINYDMNLSLPENNLEGRPRSSREEFFDDEQPEVTPAQPYVQPFPQQQVQWQVIPENEDRSTPVYLSDISGLISLPIRHSAAAALHPYIEKWIPLDKLEKIVNDVPKNTLWNKMFGRGKQKDKKRGATKTFGVPLEDLIEDCGVETSIGFGPAPVRIPIIMDECISNMKRQENRVDRESALQLVLCLLPKPNIDLLCVLVRFFKYVSSYATVATDPNGGNKMNLDNLATVIAPNILVAKTSTAEQSGLVVEIVKTIFKSQDVLFRVSLYANLTSDLLIDDREKFGLYLDMLETFELLIPSYRNQVRDWKSGKEAADWIAANLEEAGRLEDVE
ncbi:hypothetical protein HK103_002715 [Boothiomyces macroporosus]|uniref:RhoGAP-domain-containing protein n=1 Tax=Boothiomyces macroporosus TaxID=261099 RepID=A0AAD5Y6I1_9FUNG|nr:hypothetical protein HK103_002715 [Boothiomyces macroporosus]